MPRARDGGGADCCVRSRRLMWIVTAVVLGIGLQRPINWLERRGLRRGPAAAVIVVSVVLGVAAAGLGIWVAGLT